MTKLTVAVSGPTGAGKTVLLDHLRDSLIPNFDVSKIAEKMSPEGFEHQFQVEFHPSMLRGAKNPNGLSVTRAQALQQKVLRARDAFNKAVGEANAEGVFSELEVQQHEISRVGVMTKVVYHVGVTCTVDPTKLVVE